MDKFTFNNCQQIVDQIPESFKQQKLSIIMPFYNEEELIVTSVKTVVETLRKWSWNFEIILSDDGSTDQSLNVLQECQTIPEFKLISSPRNYGKGRALVTGYEISEGDYILFLDADLELSIQHLPYFIQKMIQQDSDIIIGSKEDPRSNLEYPFFRKIISFIYALIVRILFRLPVTDTQTGIKLFKRQALEETLPYLLVKKFAFDIELLALANSKSFKISTHPIVLTFIRQTAFGRISFDSILHMIKDTMAIVWRFWTRFWHFSYKKTTPLKHVFVSLDRDVTCYDDNIFYIDSMNQLPDIMPQINSYDIVIFLNKQDEVPIFMKFTINRIFSDPNIHGVYPFLYPKSETSKGFLYYNLLANMFFAKGYYPRYRPVREGILQKDYRASLSINKLVIRTSTLQDLIANNTMEVNDLTNIIHSPYLFIHSDFPDDEQTWKMSLKETEPAFGIKKNMQILYLICILLALGSVMHIFFLLPLMLLEAFVLFWFIFSLGIRRGIKAIILFYKMRFTI
ncbi:MAG: glycosyltransferase family 2 protein [Brevinema sp.]